MTQKEQEQEANERDYLIFHRLHFPHLKRPALRVDPPKSPAALFLSYTAPVSTTLPFLSVLRNKYVLQDVIGYGSSCIVRKAIDQTTQETVAIKIAHGSSSLQKELETWQSLHHPFVLSLKHTWIEKDTYYLISNYCAHGSLLSYLNQQRCLDEKEAKRLFRQLCQGIQYLHQQCRLCHKDLKLENILLDHDFNVKICDFGLALSLDQQEQEMTGGSLAYVAPEQLMSAEALAKTATDVWSLGVILYGLVVGNLPFMEGYDLKLQQAIMKGQFTMPSHLSKDLQELIVSCLAYDPNQRWTITDILNSLWLMP
ncbi:kinase-like domain-containing protein [Choanephora cucurbitarum]|nr:kinase-like domain-containing protein [Choanephora cucurbitarum]